MDLRGTSATMRNIEGDIHAIKVYHTDAYKLAVQQGFEGTLNEWLASLKGAPGDPGKSAYQYAVDAGFKGTEEEFTQKLEADEVLEAEYGVTPIEDIIDAHNAGKAIVCKYGGLLLPLVQRDRHIATFSGIYDGKLHVIVNNDGAWSWTTDSYVKAVEVRNVDHDDTIPTVRAVYQKVAQSEEALTNVMPLIANRVSTPSGYSFDKTYEEIKEAVAAGRTILLNNYNVLYAKSDSGPNYYEFLPFVTAETDVSKPGLKVTSADVWSEVATGVEPMTEDKVNELIDGRKELFVAVYGTTTTAELAEAVSSGKLCVCQLPNDDGGNKRGIALLRDNNGLNHFMFNAVLNSGTHAYALLDRSGWSYVEHPFVVDHKPLHLTGAVEATYDGSKEVSVEIPQGGGGTEWEIIRDITLEEEVSLNIIVTTKDNGETFKYKKVACAVVVGDTALPSGWNILAINPDPNSNQIWNGDAVVKRYFSPAAKKTYFFSYEFMGDSVVNQYVAELGGNVVLSTQWRKGESITEAAWVKAYETEITGVSYQINGTYPTGSRFIFYGMK